jgi:coenzyme F420-0:L-glutamate ligase/coenzyme F420-1:gamma-L-glutamate ligase
MVTEMSAVDSARLSQLIRDRRSIRHFADRPVPRSLIADLLCDVLWAPSPHNAQPWRFTVLFSNHDKHRLARAMAGRLAAELRVDGVSADLIERQSQRSYERISAAPVALLCSITADGLVRYPDERRNELEWQMAVQSVGAALQSLFLLAHARGLGSCWMAAPMYCPDVVRDVLGFPQEYAPQALVLLGYPARDGKVRPRRPFDEVVDLR